MYTLCLYIIILEEAREHGMPREETDLGPLPQAEGPGLFLLKSSSMLRLMGRGARSIGTSKRCSHRGVAMKLDRVLAIYIKERIIPWYN